MTTATGRCPTITTASSFEGTSSDGHHHHHHYHREDTVVRMIEIVTSGHTINGTVMDTAPLLKLMDICTCAAAEKHTKVNCVTVSMSDVVFEYFPKCGDLLELTARVVYAGNTSLDVFLNVMAEQGQEEEDEEEGRIPPSLVCEANFTYVTTKGPNGEKRFCPPLVLDAKAGSEQFEWEMKMSQHRRNLLSVERKQGFSKVPTGLFTKTTTTTTKDAVPIPGFDLQMTEVVLPLHQNHMGHTFGGIVMAWMAKAALAVASRKSKRRSGLLLVRSVLRIEFKCGSNVSDHLLFRSRLNAIFDGGRSAEVEVRVSKRSLSTGEETAMNVGYFYISGSEIGTGTDIPFHNRPEMVLKRSLLLPPAEQEALAGIRKQADWRRMLLLARRQLLGGVGDAVKWHSVLQDEAPMLTVKSLLRLVHHQDDRVEWQSIPNDSASVATVQWTSGENWGRSNTFVLRVKGGRAAGPSLDSMMNTLLTKRPQWDDYCLSVRELESSKAGVSSEHDDDSSQIRWDIVRHEARTPTIARRASFIVAGVETAPIIPYCLLRAWQVDNSAGTAILASQSVGYDNGSTVEGSSATVRPSGWFLDKVGGTSPEIQLTYIVEHDLLTTRKVCVGMSDENVVDMMARIAVQWFDQFLGMEHGE